MHSHRHALDRIEQICREQQVTLLHVAHRMDQLPETLGHPWTTYRTIRLNHILGQDMDLPMDLFITPQASSGLTLPYLFTIADKHAAQFFDGFLKFFFKDKPGSRFVDRRDYELSTSDGEPLLIPTDSVAEWKSRIKPGAVIEMNAVLRLLTRTSYDLICPSCNKFHESPHALSKQW